MQSRKIVKVVLALVASLATQGQVTAGQVKLIENAPLYLKPSYSLGKHYGIRPDVGSFILDHYESPAEAAAAAQLAKTVQLALVINASDPVLTQMVVDRMTRALRCASKTFKSDKKVKELIQGVQEATVNNPLRREAYDEFNDAMKQAAVRRFKGDATCDLKILS